MPSELASGAKQGEAETKGNSGCWLSEISAEESFAVGFWPAVRSPVKKAPKVQASTYQFLSQLARRSVE
jgi:hypothetical protein